jgi:hypothetical protein
VRGILAPYGECMQDIATFAWVFSAPYAGLSLEKYPNISAWMKRIEERPAVLEGLDVPAKNTLKEALNDPKAMEAIIKDAQGMMVSTKARGQ